MLQLSRKAIISPSAVAKEGCRIGISDSNSSERVVVGLALTPELVCEGLDTFATKI